MKENKNILTIMVLITYSNKKCGRQKGLSGYTVPYMTGSLFYSILHSDFGKEWLVNKGGIRVQWGKKSISFI